MRVIGRGPLTHCEHSEQVPTLTARRAAVDVRAATMARAVLPSAKDAAEMRDLGSFKHAFSHRRHVLHVEWRRVAASPQHRKGPEELVKGEKIGKAEPARWAWRTKSEIRALGMTKTMRTIIETMLPSSTPPDMGKTSGLCQGKKRKKALGASSSKAKQQMLSFSRP